MKKVQYYNSTNWTNLYYQKLFCTLGAPTLFSLTEQTGEICQEGLWQRWVGGGNMTYSTLNSIQSLVKSNTF